MRKLFILCGFAGLAVFNSCTDHEVIPPPVPLVELDCDCEAEINDSLVTYNDSCYYDSEKIITGGVSTARYRTRIEEEDVIGGLQIEMRSLNWTDDGSNNPTVEEWKTFFMDNPTPNYSDNADHNGVEVRWTDPNGNIWISDTSLATCFQSFTFNTLIFEEDTTGMYMKFDATFNCKLYNSDYGVVDSAKCLVNANVRSAFKLE